MMMDTSVDNNIGGNTGRSNNNSYSNNNFNFEPISKLNVKYKLDDNSLEIIYKPSEIKFNKILDALKFSEVQIKEMTINETKLEDVFLKLTKN